MKLKTSILNSFRSLFKIPFIEKRLKKLVKGKNSTSFFGKIVPNNYQYRRGSWRVCEQNGVVLKVDIYDYVGHYIYYQFKDIAQEKLVSLAKEGYYILDIGTNIGSTTLSFARKIGKNGAVYGFEPDPENYRLCMQNIKLNNYTNINVSNFALGSEVGNFTMVVDTESNRGGNRITFNETTKSRFEVKVDTLDNWEAQVKLKKLNLVKIDVEGFELQVLKGGEKVLKKYQPILFIELDDNNLRLVGDSANKLVSFLSKEVGYKSIINAENNEPITIIDDFSNCHFDIIVS